MPANNGCGRSLPAHVWGVVTRYTPALRMRTCFRPAQLAAIICCALLCSALLSRLRVSPSALYSCVCPPAHRAIAPHPPEPPAPSVCPQRPTITNSLRERPRNAFFLSSCADMHLSVLWKIRHAPYRADNPPSARCVADAAGTLSTYALRPRPLICPFFPPLPLFILPSVSDSFTRPLNAFPPPHPSSPLLTPPPPSSALALCSPSLQRAGKSVQMRK